MRKIIALILLVAAVSAVGIGFNEPSGEYSYGLIPVSVSFEPNSSVTLQLVKGDIVLGTKTVGEPYSTSFEALERGNYTIRASAEYNGTSYENSTSFWVNCSKTYIALLAPKNQTYTGMVPLEVVPQRDNSFVHGAKVTVAVGGNTYTLPEGQNSYRSKVALPAGRYLAVASVNGESKSVSFTVAGVATEGNKTEYLPGLGSLEIKRTSPNRARYMPGDSVKVAAYLLDQSGQHVGGAVVKAIIKSPDGLVEAIPLQEMVVAGRPSYEASYSFSQDGFYEAMLSATKAGYKNATLYMPAIRVGKEAPELPKGAYCQNGLCVRVESPKESETYPNGSQVSMKMQLIREQDASPVAGAKAYAKWGNTTLPLSYGWNGYYQNKSANISKGDYIITFHAESNGISVEKNASLHISPDQLAVSAISPEPGGNITTDFTTLQVKVADQNGDAVMNADVRVIVTTPMTGTRTVPLSRNPQTGYYEAEYTFANGGQYTFKIVASKIGYVSSEALYTANVIKAPEKMHLTEEDVVISALIIGVLIVIATLWKALL